jgi:malonyl-CoA O-methyltransferase
LKIATDIKINKKILALHFSGSAGDYDSNADLQREIAFQLADWAFPPQSTGKKIFRSVLEIGCGTGLLTAFLLDRLDCKTLVALDLAGGMLEQARLNLLQSAPPVRLVLADGEQLPLDNNSFDLAASSTTFQWFDDLEKSLAGIRRVLRPGGELVFASLVRGTFRELRESYRTAAGQLGICLAASRYGPTLPDAPEITGLLDSLGFDCIELKRQTKFEYFANAQQFLRSIKARGANNPNFRPMSLPTEKALLGKMVDFYNKRFRVDGMVHATYEVVFVRARRSE